MGENRTWRNFELVLYPESTNWAMVEAALSLLHKWAWILHDKDEGRKPHWHIMCQPKSPMNTSTIVNRFGCGGNQIEKIKGTWADALDYLTHGNAKDKHQYDVSEVHANFDWEGEAEDSTRNRREKMKWVLDGICSGEIRQYNVTDYITGEEWVRYERKIRSAFAYRDKYVKAHLEELIKMKNVVWIYGQTGTGKTTFAKECAKGYNLVYTLTSLGKNPFDDYLDEPCVIVDDLRPADLTFVDLLGVLDPYNFRQAAARYHNKALQTQLVIVTTIVCPEVFAQQCNGDKLYEEDARQLYRRINTVFEVRRDTVIEYEYNEHYEREIINRYPNYWLQMAEQKKRKRTNSVFEKMAESAMDELGAIAGTV